MAGFFYYFPGPSSVNNAEKFRELGVGYAVHAGAGVTCGRMTRGPDKGEGALVVVSHNPPAMSEAGRAKWVDAGDYWVGFDPKSPPGPQDLVHAETIDGHQTLLGDGAHWLIPVARYYDGSTTLPRKVSWSKDGWEFGDVIGVHKELWGAACTLFDALVSADGTAVTVSDELDMIAAALSVNYRIGPPEIALLELLTTTNRETILKALVDWPAFMEFVKKKTDSESESSAPGEAA